jgi:hypothetical protein
MQKRVKKKKDILIKTFSILTSLLIITLLILSGPAKAFSLEINLTEDKIKLGQQTSFIVTLNIDSNERLPIEYLTLEIIGPKDITCEFKPNGEKISGCENLSISPISYYNYTQGKLEGNDPNINYTYNWGYGYGYEGTYGYGYEAGYGYNLQKQGYLKYNITLNTTDLEFGEYTTHFKARIGHKIFSQEGEKLTIIEEINITNLPTTPNCVHENQNITLRANITGSIKEVFLETEIQGQKTNHTTQNLQELYYKSIKETGGEDLKWRFIVIDLTNSTKYGEWQTTYIYKKTTLTIDPNNPNGENNWYTTEPTFYLENSDSTNTYYRWDSTGNINYTNPFGLENIPNPSKESAGVLKLSYFSTTLCGTEDEQSIIINVDLTSPRIQNLKPENNSLITNPKPEISAYLNEIYQSNSKINLSSVKMTLNEEEINLTVNRAGTQDAIASYTPQNNLPNGEYNVIINATDYAGNSNYTKWSFYINTTEPEYELKINSPQNQIYNTRKINIDLESEEIYDEISYINLFDRNPRPRRLCRNCDTFNRSQFFSEGNNSLSFIAIKENEIIAEKNISFFIDSKSPRISRTQPTRGLTNGTLKIEFREDNPKNLTLSYTNNSQNKSTEINLSTCTFQRNVHSCIININLTEFENQEITYWFKLTDIANNQDTSRKIELKVDTTPPKINISHQITRGLIELEIAVEEENFDKITYINTLDRIPRERNLCTRLKDNTCIGRISLSDGNHNIIIIAKDKAGNTIQDNQTLANIFIDTKPPRISRTNPTRGFAQTINNSLTLFEVEFRENNPKEIILYYGKENDFQNYTLDYNLSCITDRTTKCHAEVNLSDYNNQEIEYLFYITDIVNNTDTSRTSKLSVDTTAPIIEDSSIIEETSRRVRFFLNITEENFQEAGYIDLNDPKKREIRLCTRLRDSTCEVTRSFRTGTTNLLIYAKDKAGNYDSFHTKIEIT